ncbi:MAG: ABC transporter permease [Acidobacteriota bacterium]
MTAASVSIIAESFRLATLNLLSNRIPTILTTLGIVIGIACVITVSALITSLDTSVTRALASQGSTVFTITKAPSTSTARADTVIIGHRKEISEADIAALQGSCGSCEEIGEDRKAVSVVKYNGLSSEEVLHRGVSTNIFSIESLNVAQGRSWNDFEGGDGVSLAVIGSDVAEKHFSKTEDKNPIDKIITIDGREYRVIGVLRSVGSILGFSRDNVVFTPIKSFTRTYGTVYPLTILIRTSPSSFDSAVDESRAILRGLRNRAPAEVDDGFTIELQDALVDLYRSATSNLYLATIGLAAISLIAGGIIVMNTMLVAVTERTSEIGVRRSVGAKRSHILLQFMAEAVSLSLLGSIFGVLLGFTLVPIFSALFGFSVQYDFTGLVYGVLSGASIGIFFGLYPAWRAARLSPIEAMRQGR